MRAAAVRHHHLPGPCGCQCALAVDETLATSVVTSPACGVWTPEHTPAVGPVLERQSRKGFAVSEVSLPT